MKLLVADDDLTSRTMLAAVTRMWGFEPVVAEDGEAAWQILLDADAPLLLLIDWEMPKLNGLELCQRIRQHNNDNPPFIILLTARSETDDIVTGLEAGANDHISKPFANAELQARLKVGQRMLELQGELKKTQNVLTHEREVIENIILKMHASKPFETKQLRKLDVPVEKTSGDILLSAITPDKTHHIMLGDFTGHGLMAAMGGPMVYDIFYTMTGKNLTIGEIAIEINRQLLAKMPTGLFLAAIFIEFDLNNQFVSFLNCGMSDILIYRKAAFWHRVPSNMLALGIVKQSFDSAVSMNLEVGDHIYAYSDGITELINNNKEEFGQERLEQTINELLTNQAPIDFLNDKIDDFREGVELFDDITLMEFRC